MADLVALARAATVVDLTHVLTPEFSLFPSYDPVRVADRFTVARDGFKARSWSFDEHCGTHVDAPAHFAADGATVDELDPAELVLEAIVLDVRARVRTDHDTAVTPDDVRDFERRHGLLPEGCALLALTGWGERAGDDDAYRNVDAAGVSHHPGFAPETTDFLLAERPGVRAIGLDTISLDIGATTDFPAHCSWLPAGRFGIENVANLERLPPRGALLIVGAPALQAGSGGPTRLLALIGS